MTADPEGPRVGEGWDGDQGKFLLGLNPEHIRS